MVTVNGKTYKGNNVSISNNKVYIDGKLENQEDEKVINVVVNGNINTLTIDYCDNLEMVGDCGIVASKNGDVVIKGNVANDVTSKNGNIVCGNVGGNVETKNGNIVHS